MPKTYITRQEKLNNDLSAWLIGTMKVKRIRQEEVALELGITQQALSYKIRNHALKYDDLIALFGILKPDVETLARLMGANTWE